MEMFILGIKYPSLRSNARERETVAALKRDIKTFFLNLRLSAESICLISTSYARLADMNVRGFIVRRRRKFSPHQDLPRAASPEESIRRPQGGAAAAPYRS